MQKSYTKNYIKIYFWQGISLVLNFLAMFIVMPYLSSEPAIFGIYSVCVSLNIFLIYADLGFIGAGQKYAAEYFIQNDTKSTIQVIGFSVFTLLIILLLFSFVFFYIGLNPELLIKNLNPGKDTRVASSLLMILAFFTPLISLQRFLQIIFAIRLEGYIVQRNNIIGNLVKILSVLWFFKNKNYDIVGYFLFVQIVDTTSAMVSYLIAHFRYHLNSKEILKSLQFSKIVFTKIRNQVFAVFFINITFIIYYEIDMFVIGKFLGAKEAGIFFIGLTMFSFLRTIFGVLFSPYSVRFNHYVGIVDMNNKSKAFLLNVVLNLTPVVIIPIVTLTLFTKPLILTWVGIDFIESVELAKYLILSYFLASISYPIAFLLSAQERLKELYFINTITPFVYWAIIALTYQFIGLKSFAISKLLAIGIGSFFYYSIMIKYLNISFIESVKKIFSPIISPIIFVLISSLLIVDYLPQEKSKFNLLITITIEGLLIVGSFVILFFSSSNFNSMIKRVLAARH